MALDVDAQLFSPLIGVDNVYFPCSDPCEVRALFSKLILMVWHASSKMKMDKCY